MLVSYTSSVIPIVISVYALSKLEKGLKKIVPTVCKTFLTPLLSLAIMVPATYLVIGPIADTVGKALASGYTGLVGLNPVIAGGLLGLIWPAAVMFGVHWGFVPIVMNNIAEYGRDTLFTITGPNNMAQAGATLGVFLKTKINQLRDWQVRQRFRQFSQESQNLRSMELHCGLKDHFSSERYFPELQELS
mgnify:CR=1 FL=1